jgi:hypothetical protein
LAIVLQDAPAREIFDLALNGWRRDAPTNYACCCCSVGTCLAERLNNESLTRQLARVKQFAD